jgi:two-component system chemotaxis sensor kinase CheA
MGFDMDSSDLIGLYLEEAEEQLQKLDDGLLHLENDPDDAEIVKEVFRAAHTLKGSSATVGLTPIAELTHAMENLLDCVRNGSAPATSERVDLLLRGTDLLRQMVDQVSRGEQAEADTAELLAALSSACDTASGTQPQAPTSSAKPSADQAAGPNTMTVRLKIADDCSMPSVRAFMVFNTIGALGDVVSADPPQDAVDGVQAGQEIQIVLTPAGSPEDVLKELGRLSEITVVEHSQASRDEQNPSPSSAAVERKPAETGPEPAARSIQTVRVGVDRLDTLMNLVAELVIGRTRVSRIESDLALKYENEELVQSLGETAVHIGRVVTELQEHIMKVRLLPVEQVFNRFPRMVRDLAHRAGKDVDFILEGQETELDRSILEDIVDPITHLLRNAVDHGVESPDERVAAGKPRRARVVLAAKQEENRIIIEVEDDGRGIALAKVKEAALKKGAVGEETLARMSDEDALQLIFASGVSTAEKVTDVSGRGVGMDVVRNNIQNLSGSIEVLTEEGKGSRFRINLPLTLAIIQALVVGTGGQVCVVPLSAVVETFRCSESDVRYVDGHPAINFRGSVLHLVELGSLLEQPSRERLARDDGSITFVVVRTGSMRVGLVVDRLIGEQEVVIKPLGAYFGDIKGVAGATILGDGRVALIVDVGSLGAIINRRKVPRPVVETKGSQAGV